MRRDADSLGVVEVPYDAYWGAQSERARVNFQLSGRRIAECPELIRLLAEVMRACTLELLGEPRGAYRRVHPNEYVNLAQSTNDAYPTALRIALIRGAKRLSEALGLARHASNG
jgi:aspartate ammonia-lyase